MLSDEKSHIRELAVRRILHARFENYDPKLFSVSKLNFVATKYIDFIDWHTHPFTIHLFLLTIPQMISKCLLLLVINPCERFQVTLPYANIRAQLRLHGIQNQHNVWGIWYYTFTSGGLYFMFFFLY